MSYIQPNSTIQFIKNCPLESSYQHTLYWAKTSTGKTAQENYFASIIKTPISKYTLTDYSYTRTSRNTIRVQLTTGDLIDCNYMRFKNNSFENKWFYAFINSIEYISNEVTEVTFTIDIMQTWYFDYNLMQCFVEREHSVTDVAGDNIVPEEIAHGNYISNGGAIEKIDGGSLFNSDSRFMVTTAFNQSTFAKYTGGSYDNIYTCLDFRIYTKSQLTSWLTELSEDHAVLLDEIINVCVVPSLFNFSDNNILKNSQSQLKYIEKFNDKYTGTYGSGSQATLDGYTPRNNKLYTYPYNFLRITSDNNSLDLAYEFFPKLANAGQYANSLPIWLYNVLFPVPTLILDAYSYQMIDNGQGVLIGEPYHTNRLEISDFPQCAVSADIYKINMGQYTSSLPVKMISSGAEFLVEQTANRTNPYADKNGLANIIKGFGWELFGSKVAQNIADTTKNAINDVNNFITNVLNTPSPLPERTAQVNGTQTSVADYNAEFKHFAWHYMSIKKDFAQRIDSYFDRFGYATKTTKIPNISARPEWNYVKTIGCLIDGSMPADVEEAIQSIYDSGITFWKNPAHVGNYSYNNKPVTEERGNE